MRHGSLRTRFQALASSSFRGTTHSMRGPDWEQILELIEEFVTGSPPRIRTSRMLSTIVSVDIVGSTERLGQLGDAAWNELLSDFYVRVERELARYVGEEIDRAGDGMLAIFDGPTRAIRCATAIQDAGRELGFTCGPAFIQARGNAWTGPCVASLSTSRLEWRRFPARARSSSRAPSRTSRPGLVSNSKTLEYISSRVFPSRSGCFGSLADPGAGPSGLYQGWYKEPVQAGGERPNHPMAPKRHRGWRTRSRLRRH